jgi:hypothetical protein
VNDEERYLFDLQGYLVIEDVLTSDEVAELHGLLDDYDLWGQVARGEIEAWSNDPSFLSTASPHTMDEPFRRLIDHPKLMPYLLETVGPKFRYDHGHMILMKRGSTNLRLHGGGSPFSPGEFYLFKDGQMHNGLVAIAISLVDAGPEDGGFACVPGSHKANLPCPPEFLTFEKSGPWVIRVPVKAGSAIMFTEGLTHGTWPWTAEHERRAVFVKYTPGQIAFGAPYPKATDIEADWSPQTQRILTEPYWVGGDGSSAVARANVLDETHSLAGS